MSDFKGGNAPNSNFGCGSVPHSARELTAPPDQTPYLDLMGLLLRRMGGKAVEGDREEGRGIGPHSEILNMPRD